MYKATLKLLDKEYKSSGKTLEEMFDGFPFKKYTEIKSRAYLTITNKDQVFERWFNAILIRRILFNKLAQPVWVKMIKDVIGEPEKPKKTKKVKKTTKK